MKKLLGGIPLSIFLLLVSVQVNALTGYTYKKVLVVSNPSSVNLLDCQVRIDLNRLNFDFTHAQSDGRDIRFTTSDQNTLLDYWLSDFDATKKTASAWVKMPSIAAGSSGNIYLFFGNASATAVSSYSNTMLKLPAIDVSRVAFYDFAAGSGSSVADATGSYNLTLAGTPTWGSVDGGAFAGGLLTNTFSGSYITIDGTSSETITNSTLLNTVPSTVTISLWFRPAVNRPTTGNPSLFAKLNVSSPANYLACYIDCQSAAPDYGKMVLTKASGGTVHTVKSRRKRWRSDKWYYIVCTASASGLSLWVDGIQEAVDLTSTDTWGNGSADVFRLGGGANNANNFAADFYGLLVETRVPDRDEIQARFQRRKYYPIPTSQFAKWQKYPSNPVVTAVSGRAYIGEASIHVDQANNQLDGYFASVNSGATISEAYRKTTSDGITWSTGQVVLGNSIGGETGKVSRNSIYYESGTYYLYYCLLNDLKIYVATSTDGVTFTKQSGSILTFVSPFTSVDNTCVVKTGTGAYVMLVDGFNGSAVHYGGGVYQLSLASATSPLGPFAFPTASQSANVQTTVEFAKDNQSGYGPYLVRKPGAGWHLWSHCKNPGYIYYAYTADSTLLSNSWQVGPNNPAIIITPTLNSSTDQSSDIAVAELNGNSYGVFATADNTTNPPVYVNCDLVTYAGSLNDLVKEIPITFGAETSASAQKVIYTMSGQKVSLSGQKISSQ